MLTDSESCDSESYDSQTAEITLILGGARSGKSRFAEALTRAHGTSWTYIATAEAGDQEMADRIAQHRARRGDGWTTLEAPLDLPDAIRQAPAQAILVDCLTLWLSNLLLDDSDIAAASEDLCQALAGVAAPVVLVANEVGLAIVPDNALARRFRDHAGNLNQTIAEQADNVSFVVAGLPLTLKGADLKDLIV